MNAILPSGIESYLKEAGFSATEMLLLRKLVEEDSLTIRELASKTGKSTGVLDQAMKKLMTKKIAQKTSSMITPVIPSTLSMPFCSGSKTT